MRTTKFVVSIDVEANAAYVGMSDREVRQTREASDEILVDLDQYDVVVGIEFLRIDAEIPFSRLVDEFHVHSDDIEQLHRLRPSVAASMMSSAEGVSAPTRSRAFVTS